MGVVINLKTKNMNKKNKSLIVFISIIGLTSIGESLFPIFPFIAIGCFATYMLGKTQASDVIKSLPTNEDEWFDEHEAFVTEMKIDDNKTTYEHLQNAFYWFKKRYGGDVFDF